MDRVSMSSAGEKDSKQGLMFQALGSGSGSGNNKPINLGELPSISKSQASAWSGVKGIVPFLKEKGFTDWGGGDDGSWCDKKVLVHRDSLQDSGLLKLCKRSRFLLARGMLLSAMQSIQQGSADPKKVLVSHLALSQEVYAKFGIFISPSSVVSFIRDWKAPEAIFKKGNFIFGSNTKAPSYSMLHLRLQKVPTGNLKNLLQYLAESNRERHVFTKLLPEATRAFAKCTEKIKGLALPDIFPKDSLKPVVTPKGWALYLGKIFTAEPPSTLKVAAPLHSGPSKHMQQEELPSEEALASAGSEQPEGQRVSKDLAEKKNPFPRWSRYKSFVTHLNRVSLGRMHFCGEDTKFLQKISTDRLYTVLALALGKLLFSLHGKQSEEVAKVSLELQTLLGISATTKALLRVAEMHPGMFVVIRGEDRTKSEGTFISLTETGESYFERPLRNNLFYDTRVCKLFANWFGETEATFVGGSGSMEQSGRTAQEVSTSEEALSSDKASPTGEVSTSEGGSVEAHDVKATSPSKDSCFFRDEEKASLMALKEQRAAKVRGLIRGLSDQVDLLEDYVDEGAFFPEEELKLIEQLKSDLRAKEDEVQALKEELKGYRAQQQAILDALSGKGSVAA